ncbi:L-rhamnose mutarotase [Streptomyces lasalocidi]
MRRVCFLLKVRAERLDAYRERHAAVRPGTLDAPRATGRHNDSLFLREDGLLVGCLETEDFAARAGTAATGVNARRQARTAPFSESPDGARPDEARTPLTEVFHLS